MQGPSVVLIFSGNNQRAVVAFCRFAISANINFAIVARNSEDTIFKTEYKSKVIATREQDEFSVEEFSKYYSIIRQSAVILPSTEYLNRFLINNKYLIEKTGFIIPLCSPELYEQISDKHSFGNLCKKYSITVPFEYSLVDKSQVPFVAKPTRYMTEDGAILKPELILTDTDFDVFQNNFKQKDFYFQEFVGGSSYYLLYHFSKDDTYSSWSQENLVQQNNGRSVILAVSSHFHEQSINEQIAKMFVDIGFFGLVMVEVKYFNSKYYVIEANPRLWGPSQLILDSGMDLFHKFALDNKLIYEVVPANYQTNQFYFWLGGLTEDQKSNLEVSFHNYNTEQFVNKMPSILDKEIYNRKDTIQIHQLENHV